MNKDSKPKVLLRALEPEDLDLLYGIENNPEVWDVSPTNVPYSRYVLHNYLANTVNDIYVDKQVRFVIDADKEQCIGLLDVVHFDPKHRRAEVSIVLRKEFRKKGLAQSALVQLLDYSLRVLHLHQLYAVVPKANQASVDLFTRVGFKINAELKDWLFDGENYNDAILMQYIL